MDKIREISFLDGEFTGLNPFQHEMVWMGVIKVRQERLEDGSFKFTELSEIDLKLKPSHIETADPDALKVFGYSEDEWKDAPSQKEGLEILKEYVFDLDEEPPATNWAILGGHNIHYDSLFISQAYNDAGIYFRSNKYAIDTHSIASALLFGRDDIRSLSLSGLCEFFGIENEKAHTALSDARATYEVYKRLLEFARTGSK